MGLFAALRRPAVRIPLLLAVAAAVGALAARECRSSLRGRELAGRRHLRFMEMVSRAAAERAGAGRRPGSLAELVSRPGEPGAIETLYLREYAGLPEFAGGPSLDVRVRGAELAWGGYCYRLWPSPRNGRDFLIFAWPEAPGAGRLASAFVSTDPGHLYYTFATRYAGADAGPRPEDLGEPFGGQVRLMPGLGPQAEPADFLEKAARSDGKLWARMQVRPGGPPASP